MERKIQRVLGALLSASVFSLGGTALAQAPAEETRERAAEDSRLAFEERLRQIEERDRAREAELAAALSRVGELERASADAAAREAEERARLAAEAAAAETAAAQAPAGPPTIVPLASMFTRFEHREGYTQLGVAGTGCIPGDSDCVRYRARVGVSIPNLRISDEVVAGIRFLPQVAGFWAVETPAGMSTSGNVFHPSLGLYEGYLSLTIEEELRVDVGRFAMVYGEHLVIGTLGWHPAARSFDGARLRFQPEANGYYVDAFFTMLSEGGPAGFGDADSYFYGIYAGLGPVLGQGVQLDAYALALQNNDSIDPMTGGRARWSVRVTVGGRFRHRVDIVDLRLETGIQVGRVGRAAPFDPRALLAAQVDGEVGINLLDDVLRLSVQGLYASGDDASTLDLDEAYNHLFPTAHAFLGLTDVAGGRSNIASGVLHAMVRALPQLRLMLDVHLLSRVETGGSDSLMGGEGDLHVVWTPGAGFVIRAMYGLFIPNPGFWGAGVDPVHYVEVELGYEL